MPLVSLVWINKQMENSFFENVVIVVAGDTQISVRLHWQTYLSSNQTHCRTAFFRCVLPFGRCHPLRRTTTHRKLDQVNANISSPSSFPGGICLKSVVSPLLGWRTVVRFCIDRMCGDPLERDFGSRTGCVSFGTLEMEKIDVIWRENCRKYAICLRFAMRCCATVKNRINKHYTLVEVHLDFIIS